MKKNTLSICLLFAILLQVYFVFTFWQYKKEIVYFFPIVTIYSILHFIIYKNTTVSQKEILYIGIPIHIAFIFSVPFLSDDIFRYLWDGIVSFNGVNPYIYSPEAFPHKDIINQYEYFKDINHSEFSTLYLPIPQIIFMSSAIFQSPMIAYKGIVFLSLLVTIHYIMKIDSHHKLNNKLLFMYLLHPLVIYEVSSSAHLDIFYVNFTLIAYYYSAIQKRSINKVFWWLATLTRPLSIIYTSYFKKNKSTTAFLALLLACFYFYLNTIPHSGLNAYSSEWHFNHLLFENIRTGLLPYYNEIHSVISYKTFIKICSAILVLALAFLYKKRFTKFEEYIIYTHLVFTFLSPTIYPWYLIVIIPFATLSKNHIVLIFTYTVLLSYWVLIDYFSSNVWSESLFIIAFEYGIPFVYFLLKEIKRRKNIPKIRAS